MSSIARPDLLYAPRNISECLDSQYCTPSYPRYGLRCLKVVVARTGVYENKSFCPVQSLHRPWTFVSVGFRAVHPQRHFLPFDMDGAGEPVNAEALQKPRQSGVILYHLFFLFQQGTQKAKIHKSLIDTVDRVRGH
jgi:hypothetical protein